MIDFKEIPHDADDWELFARDFLQAMGFIIESPPDRGADGGKDLLVIEEVHGVEYKGHFRWLVSCKHYAHSGRAVNATSDEHDILDRVRSFKAKGFIGFYSTLASGGLNSRLQQLRDNGEIEAYRIFDHKLIENYLVTIGYSRLMIRYLPNSYRTVKPLHRITDKYEPIQCEHCGVDLLEDLFLGNKSANMVWVHPGRKEAQSLEITNVYVACKGECDRTLEEMYRARGLSTSWKDINDWVIPLDYLRTTVELMNRLRSRKWIFSDAAWDSQKGILIALAQKVMRDTTEAERDRVKELQWLSNMGV